MPHNPLQAAGSQPGRWVGGTARHVLYGRNKFPINIIIRGVVKSDRERCLSYLSLPLPSLLGLLRLLFLLSGINQVTAILPLSGSTSDTHIFLAIRMRKVLQLPSHGLLLYIKSIKETRTATSQLEI